MIHYGGWKPDVSEPDPQGDWAKSRLYYNGNLPIAMSLINELMLDDILDQHTSSACVAHAVSAASRLRHAYAANVSSSIVSKRISCYPLPSRRWGYRLSRETHGEAHIDDGTFISSMLYVFENLGWPSEVQVPWDLSKINDPMTASERRHAFDQKGVIKHYSITKWGDERIRLIKNAIVSGYPIVCGIYVDAQFDECRQWERLDLKGERLGGHAIVLFGYDPEGVYVLNSWGLKWGMGGLGLIGWDAISKRIRDIRVITMTKEPTT